MIWKMSLLTVLKYVWTGMCLGPVRGTLKQKQVGSGKYGDIL
jgi:hypothetical protein